MTNNTLKSNQHWRFNKNFSFGHVIAALSVATSVVVYISSIENRINVNALKIQTNKELITTNDKNISATINRIDKRLETITNILLKQGQ